MSVPRSETLPRGALFVAGGLVIGSLIAATTVRVTHSAPSDSPALLRAQEGARALVTRDLRFTDRPDGSVLIEDVSDDRVAGTVAAGSETGFIRGVMRGLARDRHKRGLGSNPPFRLTRWSDGQLTLTDSVTARSIELGAFGSTNRAAFAALLP